MHKKNLILPALTVLFALLIVGQARAQRPRPSRAAATRTPNVLQLLPVSDAVITVDVQRLFKEGIAGVFGAEPARQAHVNEHIEKFKSKTGVDPRLFERLAVGLRYTYPRPGITKVESVAIARGKFNPTDLVAAGRRAAAGSFKEQKYKGAAVYVFSLNEEVRLLGLYTLRINELAVSVLDANTLVIGSEANVRAAIDAGKAGKRVSNEVIALATSDPKAFIGFGGNVTPALWKNLDMGDERWAKDLASVRQVFAAAGVNGANLYVTLAARTYTPAQALSLSEVITAVRQMAPLFVANVQGARNKLAQGVIDNLKITSQGNEVRIATEVRQADLAILVR